MIDSAASAEAFAAALEAQQARYRPRYFDFERNRLRSRALRRQNRYEARRQVIDVSGDGPNNYGPPVTGARDEAVARGHRDQRTTDLDQAVADRSGYRALLFRLRGRRARLFRPAGEARVPNFRSRSGGSSFSKSRPCRAARIIPAVAEEPTDCLIGERMRELYADPYYPGLDN